MTFSCIIFFFFFFLPSSPPLKLDRNLFEIAWGLLHYKDSIINGAMDGAVPLDYVVTIMIPNASNYQVQSSRLCKVFSLQTGMNSTIREHFYDFLTFPVVPGHQETFI